MKDPGMSKELGKRCACCLAWMRRPLPTASPNGSDDKGEHGKDEEESEDMDGVVVRLLGLMSTPQVDVGLEGGGLLAESGVKM